MKRREVMLNEEVIGEALCDAGVTVFHGLSEELEDMLYQGFYMSETDDESYIAPDENGEKYFKLLGLFGFPGLTFGKIEELG